MELRLSVYFYVPAHFKILDIYSRLVRSHAVVLDYFPVQWIRAMPRLEALSH